MDKQTTLEDLEVVQGDDGRMTVPSTNLIRAVLAFAAANPAAHFFVYNPSRATIDADAKTALLKVGIRVVDQPAGLARHLTEFPPSEVLTLHVHMSVEDEEVEQLRLARDARIYDWRTY